MSDALSRSIQEDELFVCLSKDDGLPPELVHSDTGAFSAAASEKWP